MPEEPRRTALEVFQKFAAIAEPEPSREFLASHPVLLSPSRWAEFDAWVASLPEDTRGAALRARSIVQGMYEYIVADPRRYPFGAGPIERLLSRVQEGEISLEHACRSAGDPAFGAQLSPLYVRLLMGAALSRCVNGDWRTWSPLARLTIAALENREPDADQNAMWGPAVLNWLDIVSAATLDVPDGRLFHPAVRMAETLLDDAFETDDPNLRGEALHRLGVLHLDPYLGGRNLQHYGPAYRAWRNRLEDEHGEELTGDPEEQLPELEDALASAESYLRRALPLRTGVPRARTLKALAEALANGALVSDRAADKDEVVRLATEAFELFDPDQHPHERIGVATLLTNQGADVPDGADADWLCTESLDAIVDRLGAARAIDSFRQEIGRLHNGGDPSALDLWRRARPLFDRHASPAERMAFFATGLNSMVLFAPPLPAGTHPSTELGATAERIAEEAVARGDEQGDLGSRLLALATHSSASDREAEGLRVLEVLLRTCPEFVKVQTQLVQFLHASLLVGVGANAYRADEPSAAARAYFEALASFLKIDFVDGAMDMLRRAADLVSAGDAETLHTIVVGLTLHFVELESRAGLRATRVNRVLCQSLMASLAAGGAMNPQVVVFLWQVAKGARFATALRSGAQYNRADDSVGSALLARIASAQDALRAAGADGWGLAAARALDSEDFLGAYVGEPVLRGSESPVAKLENLELGFDAHFERCLVSGAERFELLTIGRLQAALGERSVLLAYLLGATTDGMAAVYILLVTNDWVHITAGVDTLFPAGVVVMSEEESTARVHHMALAVSSVRKKLQRAPLGDDAVDGEAAELLESAYARYLGGDLADHLDRLRTEGKDHLVVVPHGPLHFFPFHLMQRDGRTLSEEWIVTYQPNLALLGRAAPALDPAAGQTPDGSAARGGFTAIGCDFAATDPHGCGPLPNAEQEAQDLARLLGGSHHTGPAATEAALRDALTTARRVHVATHGEHRVHAPAFQRMFVMPDAESDGVVNAYELLDLDLRGLDLLTLSACETGLGRFDESDNLRGLPAALLLAGAQTLVVALWPVETHAAAQFFRSFYARIGAGDEKRDAFGVAQRETRAAFPQHRDWGAFQLLGAAR